MPTDLSLNYKSNQINTTVSYLLFGYKNLPNSVNYETVVVNKQFDKIVFTVYYYMYYDS